MNFKEWCIENNKQTLLDEWDYEKNELGPDKYAPSSNKVVWWKCPVCGNEWKSSPNTRHHSNGCIKCHRDKSSEKYVSTLIKKNGSLEDNYPDIAKEWHPYKNGDRKPSEFTSRSGQKVWWKCSKCGNEWEATIAHRTTDGRGCPICSKERLRQQLIKLTVTKDHNFASVHPELAKEWHPTKNQDLKPEGVSPVSSLIVWWQCTKCGYEWQSKISNRVFGNGCPRCSFVYQTSEPEQAVFYYVQKEFPDAINSYHPKWLGKRSIDVYVPSLQLAIEYDGGAWHKDSDRDNKKAELLKEHGITLARIREKHASAIDDGSIQFVSQKTTEDISVINKPLEELFLWIGKTYNINVNVDIDVIRDYEDIIAIFREQKEKRSLKKRFPELLEEWNYEKNEGIDPGLIPASSNKKVWWKCSRCGNEWKAVVNSRTRAGVGCPVCGRKELAKNRYKTMLERRGSAASVNPELLSEWNTDKNGDLSLDQFTPQSGKIVWWKCSKCGYEWETSIVNRTKGHGCPICKLNEGLMQRHRKKLESEGSLKDNHPELEKDWDYSKNTEFTMDDVLSGSNKKAWWKCSVCGHEWETQINNRAKGHGCPKCAVRLREKKTVEEKGSLAELVPRVVQYWNYDRNKDIDPHDLSVNSNKVVWWKCPKCFREWQEAVRPVVNRKKTCKNCSSK